MKTIMKRSFFLSGFCLFLILGFVLRKFVPVLYTWVTACASLAVAFAFLTGFLKTGAGKTVALTVMSVIFAIGAGEAYIAVTDIGQSRLLHKQRVPIEEIRKERGMPELQKTNANLVNDDPDLGIKPRRGRVRMGHKVVNDDTVLFDVIYSTLDSGWRVTPQNPSAKTAVVFFGCSFTYGEGLNDEDSFPFKVGQILGPQYQVYNFGMSGYGSHQMLAQIQSGILDDMAKQYEEIVVLYTTIEAHEIRSAGFFSSWDQHGPWYELEDGKVVRKGVFSDRKNQVPRPIRKFFRKSLVFQKLLQPRQKDQPKHEALHVALISEADAELKQRYGFGLTVVLWPEAPFMASLNRAGLPVLDLHPFFPDGKFGKEFQLPLDGHPNPAGADVAAKAIAASIPANAGK